MLIPFEILLFLPLVFIPTIGELLLGEEFTSKECKLFNIFRNPLINFDKIEIKDMSGVQLVNIK